MLLLYGGTYATANSVDSFTARARRFPASCSPPTLEKFAIVSIVNMGSSLYIDSSFARRIGAIVARPLPVGSYAAFTVRGGLTMFATFNLPPLVASPLPSSLDQSVIRFLMAQVVTPTAMQLVATPLLLLGLDLYNRHRVIL